MVPLHFTVKWRGSHSKKPTTIPYDIDNCCINVMQLESAKFIPTS